MSHAFIGEAEGGQRCALLLTLSCDLARVGNACRGDRA
jgi:hypothetical protein